MRGSSFLALTAVASPVLTLSAVAHAGATPGQTCAAAKLKAASKAADASLACHAKATLKGVTVDPACLLKADTQLMDAFSRAEVRAGCTTTGDAGAVDGMLGL